MRFFVKLLLFLAPVIAAFAFVETKLANMPNNYVLKKVNLDKKANDVEVLVLGTSHALEGINPKFISHPTFNLSNQLQSLYYDIRITEQYADKLPKLKLVLISVDYFSLNYQIHSSQVDALDYYYSKYYGITYKDIPFWDIRKYSFITMHSISWTAGEIRNGFKPYDEAFIDENGYLKLDTQKHLLQISPEKGKGRASFTTKLCAAGEKEFIVKDLEYFIQFLQARHVAVAIIAAPVYHTFSDNTDVKITSGNNETVNMLCKKYGLRYYNYLTDPRFDLGDFQDNDHLNFVGAEKLSKIVDTEIIMPVLH